MANFSLITATGGTSTKAAHYGARSTIWIIVVTVGALLVFMWTALAAYIVTSRHNAIYAADLEGRNLAIAFREEVATLLRLVESDMTLIADGMRRERGNFDLYAWGQGNELVAAGEVRAIIIDPDGRLKSATFVAHPGPIDLNDRDYFPVHRDDKSDKPYFGQTVVGRLANELVLPISRRVDAADGTFLGVLVMLIPPSALTKLNKSINLGPDGVITLTGLDRRILARFSADSPDGTKGIGVAISQTPVRGTIGDVDDGSYMRAGVIDGISRIFYYSRVGSYPLIVTVGLDLGQELAAWRSSATIIALLGLFATVFLTGLAAYLVREIHIRATYQTELVHAAQHDFLTGLPNRVLLKERVDQAIDLARRRNKTVAVLYLDLDGFKYINDSLGHPIGDRLLQSIAQRLVNCVRRSDTVSRQGGDEFVVLLSEVKQSEDAAIIARKMLQAVASEDATNMARKMMRAVAEGHSIDQLNLHITTSIGVSVYPDDGGDAETLIKNADTAMYQAKENGRQGYEFFTPAMNIRAVERQSIEEGLRSALERQEFALHYQPQIDLRTGEITGAEALIRWTHPIRGPIPPLQFIPVAEACGLIVPIGNWVVREACKQAQAWLDAGLPLGTMAANISAMEFRGERFLEGVFAILEETGLDPRFLELELTESVLMKSAASAASILRELRTRGVRVAIDDFGTGYSSLSYLSRFPIDALKIDQSFVRRITTAPDETTIVTAIISLGRNLKLRVVAEGVETREELAFLRAHHCDQVQGDYFSRPVPPEQFARLLETGVSDFSRQTLVAEGSEPRPAANTAAAAGIVEVRGSRVATAPAVPLSRDQPATSEA